jgi:hypothetical protein
MVLVRAKHSVVMLLVSPSSILPNASPLQQSLVFLTSSGIIGFDWNDRQRPAEQTLQILRMNFMELNDLFTLILLLTPGLLLSILVMVVFAAGG